MLKNLHVKNFAIIDESDIDFYDHLNILTGETGAGKSILIGSVVAAIGGKVTKDIIRRGADFALAELVFDDLGADVIKELNELDIFTEDGSVTLSRRIMDNGKSVCRINGETVNANILKNAASLLIDIHGQQEHQSLIKVSEHKKLLDRYCGEMLEFKKAEMKRAYEKYRLLKEEYMECTSDSANRTRDLSYVRYAAEEIEAAALKEGEDESLENEYKTLQSAKTIVETIGNSLKKAENDDFNISEMISDTQRIFSRIANLNEETSKMYDLLVEAGQNIDDFCRMSNDYVSRMEDSRERLDEVEKRLNLINSFKNKYGDSIEKINKYAEECREKLRKYEDFDSYLEKLKADYDKAVKECGWIASQITTVRKEKAVEFSRKLEAELMDLNFSAVKFEVMFTELDDFHMDGKDECEFMISLNVGEPMKPLNKVASGGELSRVMLGIKSVMADKDEIRSLIFDEIDTGISGRTAQKVSEKLALIGRSHQIICITHLAQIAAMADNHFVIEKSVVDEKTYTGIKKMTNDEVIYELARILGGAKITDAVLENAKEMKNLANEYKSSLKK